MPERIVTDLPRVRSCQSFWRSRFGKMPSLVEVARITGLSTDRVAAAWNIQPPKPEQPRPPRPNRPVRAPVPTNRVAVAGEIETRICGDCGQPFQRRRATGRPPKYGPCCRAA